MSTLILRAVLGLAIAASLLVGCSSSSGSSPDLDLGDELAFDPDCPARDHLASEAAGRIRPGVATPFNYSYLYVAADGCTPVRFNPCQPIPYVTNEAQARTEDLEALRQSLAKVTEATGLEFVHEGTTDEIPGVRGAYVPRYGERWAPLLVAWVSDAEMEFFLGRAGGRDVRGNTTATTVPVKYYPGAGSPRMVGDVYVSGLLILNVGAVDPATDEPIEHGFGRGLNWGRVILHELGHVIGLGHVESRSSMMQHELRLQTLGTVDWGIGDELALGALGTDAGCLETPAFDPALG